MLEEFHPMRRSGSRDMQSGIMQQARPCPRSPGTTFPWSHENEVTREEQTSANKTMLWHLEGESGPREIFDNCLWL